MVGRAQIMELEKENAGLKEELATAGPSSARKGKDQDWVPGRSGGPHHVLVRPPSFSSRCIRTGEG